MDKSTQVVMFSSKTDPCASPVNAKCANFFTEAEDGLAKSWEGFNSFINPPYGRGIEKWIKKAYEESRKEETSVTMLIPARTDTKYWHQYIMKADEVYFVKGRLKFGDSKNSAPFPSAVVVFDGTNRQQIFGTINR